MVFHQNFFWPLNSSRRRRGTLDPLDALDLLGRGKGGSSDPFFLSNPVGPRGPNKRSDVVRVESLLGQMGALGGPAENDRFGAFTPPLESAVRGFQKRKGLKVDGLLNPGGPTLKALIKGLKPVKQPPLAADVFASNARTALALSRTLDPGPLPGYLAEALTAGGDGAKAEVADLLEQVAGRSPAMARRLRARVAPLVGEKERAVLYGESLLKRLAGLRENEDEDDGGAKPRPPGDQHPDAPKDPDQPDQPDPDEEKKPDPDEEKKPDPDEEKKKKCAYLREARIAATHNLEAAEKRFNEANEEWEQKADAANAKWDNVVNLVKATVPELIASLWDIKNRRIPRGVILPSEIAKAVRDYNEAMREADEALNSRKARKKEEDERKEELKEIEEKIEKLGC